MRKLLTALLVLAGLSAGALLVLPNSTPGVLQAKQKIASFIAVDARYEVPNTARDTSLPPVDRPAYPAQRPDWESRIARLFVTYPSDLDHLRSPGAVLLEKWNTRAQNRFGRYSSYDPVQTRSVAEGVRDTMQARRHDVLLYDEGEGGYVMRIGTLPAPAEIGPYLTDGTVGPTMEGHVSAAENRSDRKAQIGALFAALAEELANQGIDVVLAPMIDVAEPSYDENFVFQDDRFFSHRDAIVHELAVLYIDAMHQAGIRTVGKHFLTLAQLPHSDAHDVYMVNPADTAANNSALRLYARLANRLDGIMLAPVGNPEEEDNRLYLFSRQAVQALRDSLGFSGLIITDELGMQSIKRTLDAIQLSDRERRLTEPAESHHAVAAVLALDAGADQLLLSRTANKFPNVLATIRHAYDLDADFRARVDSALVRYDRWVNQGPRTQPILDPAQIASPE